MLAAVSCPGAVLPRARIARPAARRAGLLTAAAQSAGAAFPIGTRVRVKDSIVVYHVPKQKTGLTLQVRPLVCRAVERVLARALHASRAASVRLRRKWCLLVRRRE
jgi:hypothetical protein